MSVYYHDKSGLVEGLPGYEGRTSRKGFAQTLNLHQKLLDPYTRFVREILGWYGLRYAHMIQFLVFILLQTSMSAYYYDISGLDEGLPRYEGRTSWKGLTGLCVCTKDYGMIRPVYERGFGLVRPGVFPYYPKFWCLFSPRPL